MSGASRGSHRESARAAPAIEQRNLTRSDSKGSFSSLMQALARTASNFPGASSRVVVVVSVIGALELLIGSGAVAD
jgi:hypothetical protein